MRIEDGDHIYSEAVLLLSLRGIALAHGCGALAVVLVLIILAASPRLAQAAEPGDQPIVKDGLEMFYGVILSQIILGHPSQHPERTMHGGVPAGMHQDHLLVSLFDSATKQRIVGAKVRAIVTTNEMPVQRKALEPMQFAGSITYGNYFHTSPSGPVHIEVEVWRPGAARSVRAAFNYTIPSDQERP
ncbi:MAG TPA: hypothetical protein VFA81_05340 [Burkholderiales bacterium]|nr:hypothetical protein [Burkholderiales bacterium]